MRLTLTRATVGVDQVWPTPGRLGRPDDPHQPRRVAVGHVESDSNGCHRGACRRTGRPCPSRPPVTVGRRCPCRRLDRAVAVAVEPHHLDRAVETVAALEVTSSRRTSFSRRSSNSRGMKDQSSSPGRGVDRLEVAVVGGRVQGEVWIVCWPAVDHRAGREWSGSPMSACGRRWSRRRRSRPVRRHRTPSRPDRRGRRPAGDRHSRRGRPPRAAAGWRACRLDVSL